MHVVQEIWYRTTGAVKDIKRLKVVYAQEPNNVLLRVVYIAYAGEPLNTGSALVLPPLEVTASAYKNFDLMGRRMRGK